MSEPAFEGLAEALHFVEDLTDVARKGEPIVIEDETRLLRWVRPTDHVADVYDLEKYRERPFRPTGTATLRDLDSFIRYVNVHKIDATSVYRDQNSFTAIINGHLWKTAGWCDYRATFEPKWTPGWTAWVGFNNAWLTQDDFAEFLVNRIPEIAHPAGAEIHEAVMNLRLHWDAQYERILQPNNDFVQLRYTEDTKGGEFRMPAAFTIVVQPFVGADTVTLEARLRFAKPDEKGRIKFQYRLGEAVEQVVDAEFIRMQEAIADNCGVPVFWGTFASKVH